MVYRNIVFLQGDEADEALNILDEDGTEAAFNHLLDTYEGTGPDDYTDDEPWGESDDIEDFETRDGAKYVLSYNAGLGYIGLTQVEEEGEEEGGEEEEEGPAPEDITITSDGFRYHVGEVEGKHIGTFSEMDYAELAVHRWMQKNNFYPSVWFISDHGNVSLHDLTPLEELLEELED